MRAYQYWASGGELNAGHLSGEIWVVGSMLGI